MHDIVMNDLEKHLSGDAPQSFYEHLAGCPDCRKEVAAFEQVSAIFRELKDDPESVPQPSLGFCNRVVNGIVEHERKEAWGLFSPGAAFFRRIAFASLLVLASLGSFLVTRENSAGGADPAAIMAEQSSQPAGSQPAAAEPANRDRILVTLTSYGQ